MDKRRYLALALPVIIHQLATTSVSFIDVLMITRLGSDCIAASGICQNLYFVYYLFAGGIAGGAAIFSAQYYGRKDYSGIHKMLGIALTTVISSLSVLVVIGFFAAKPLILLTAGDAAPNVVALGVSYFQIALFSYLFQGVSLCFAYTMRSIGRPGPVLLIALVSLGCKVLLNYMLIFGYWGWPALGIRGAAMALVITRFIEMLLTLLWVYTKEKPLAATIKQLLGFDWPLLKKVISVSLPVMVNDVMFSIGMLFYVGAYCRIATDALSAVEVANTIQSFFTTVVIGLGAATAVVVGNKIGSGEEKDLMQLGWHYFRVSIVAGLAVGAMIIATIPITTVMFKVEPEIGEMVRKLLLVYGFCLVLRSISIMMTMGVLRGGGDTKFAFLIETSTIWLVGVPAVLIAALVFRWPVEYVVAFTYLEQLVKGTACLIRFKSGKWVHNLVKDKRQDLENLA